jgi:hypothetical protein
MDEVIYDQRPFQANKNIAFYIIIILLFDITLHPPHMLLFSPTIFIGTRFDKGQWA